MYQERLGFQKAPQPRVAVLGAVLTALAALTYFILSYRFYPPVSIALQGNSQGPFTAEVYFDSGRGLTAYEHLPLKISSHDPATGHFRGEVTLPPQPLRQLRFDVLSGGPVTIAAVDVAWEGGSKQLAVEIGKPTGPLPFDTAQFHCGLLLLQAALAVLIGWLVWLCATLPPRLGTASWRQTLNEVFVSNGRVWFWVVAVAATATYMCWLLAYWPGATTSDSWNSLFEVYSLRFNNWHPYIYGLYLLSLLQFARTPAAIVMFQIVVTAGTGAWILHFCHQNGVKLRYLVPFAVLFVTSIPIGLFNIILWKDVPFSIAVFLVSFLLFRVQFVRDRESRQVNIPRWSVPLLAILLVLLLHARHNGAIFYVLLPLFLLGRVKRRDFGTLVAFLALTYVTVNVWVPRVFDIPKVTGSAYHELRTALAIMTHRNYYSDDRARDIKVIEEFTGEKWDRLATLFPAKWFSVASLPQVVHWQFAREPRPTDGFNQRFLARLIMENLPIFFEARTFDFFHSIGLDTSDYSAKTTFFEDPLQLQGNNLAPPGQFMWGVSLPAEEKWPALAAKIKALDAWSRRYDGPFSPLVLVWNLAIYYALFIAVLYVERGNSAIALYTLPSLAATLGVFVAGAGESWRYFYYVYLCGLFVIPLYLAYRENCRGATA